MDARTIARGIAIGRIAIGAAIVAAPARFTRGWVGEVATQPGAQAISVALGARDVAVGIGSLLALERGADARARRPRALGLPPLCCAPPPTASPPSRAVTTCRRPERSASPRSPA